MSVASFRLPTPHEIRDLALDLVTAFEAGSEVDFRRVDQKLWALALDWLIDQSMLDAARWVTPRLAAAFAKAPSHTQHAGYFQTVADLLSRLPPPSEDTSFAMFCDDPGREVQVIPRANGSAALLAFCGRVRKLGMSINLVHRWFGQLGVHVIYLRDYQGKNYDNGIGSLAPDFVGTLRSLQRIVADLGTQRVVCYGNSLGGYGALRYALELQAEAVLAFSSPTNLDPNFGTSLVLELLSKGIITAGLDLRPLYENAGYASRAHLVYGELHASDRAQAENFSGLPTVSLDMVRGWESHAVFIHTLLSGRYEHLIKWLVDPDRAKSAP